MPRIPERRNGASLDKGSVVSPPPSPPRTLTPLDEFGEALMVGPLGKVGGPPRGAHGTLAGPEPSGSSSPLFITPRGGNNATVQTSAGPRRYVRSTSTESLLTE
jgi:hypothetical protein